MKNYLKQLHWQIFIAMIIGLIVGSIINTNSSIYSIFITFGLIFTSILTGITSISNFNQLGRIGFKTILYFMPDLEATH